MASFIFMRSSMKLSIKPTATFLFTALVAGVLSMPAYAKDSIVTTPSATLSASAAVNIAQDIVHITLVAEESADKQDAVVKALNNKLDSVMQDAKKAADITAKSGAYRVWPITNNDGKITQWRGYAEIVLKSGDFAASSALAAKLSDRMPINNLSFSVSDKAKAEHEESLIRQAVDSLNARAAILADSLGYKDYQIIKLDLGNSGNRPVSPMPRLMSAVAADAASTPIESGEENFTVSVQAEISLLPAKK